MFATYRIVLAVFLAVIMPGAGLADHRGATVAELFADAALTAEAFDTCALNPDGDDPVHHTDMSAECQAVFEPCHVRLHLPSALEYPDNQYELEDVTAMEQCLSREAERYLALLSLSHAERLELQTGESDPAAQAAASSGIFAMPYQSSARAGALCGRKYDGGSLLGYLQCLNDHWADNVHFTRKLIQERSQ